MISYLYGTGTTISTTPSTSATNYQWINATDSGGSWNATQTNRDIVVPHAMTIDQLKVKVGTSPGGGKSWVFDIMVNNATSGVTCTISGTNTSASDLSNTVSLSAGDTISLKSTPSGSPTTVGQIWWSIRQEATSLGAILGGASQNVSATVVNYNGMMSNATWNGTESNVYSIMPTAGVIKNLYIITSAAPGAAKSYTFDIMKNGSSTGVQVVIADAVQTAGNDTSNTVSYAAGDTISIRSTPSGTPNAANVTWAVSFQPTIDGESVLLFGNTTGPFGTSYDQMQGKGGGSWDSTENLRQLMAGATTVKALYIQLSSGPNNGPGTQELNFRIRQNAADTTAIVTISETATSGNITGQSISIADGDMIALGNVDTGSPAAPNVRGGVLFYVSPGSPPPSTNTGATLLMMGV